MNPPIGPFIVTKEHDRAPFFSLAPEDLPSEGGKNQLDGNIEDKASQLASSLQSPQSK